MLLNVYFCDVCHTEFESENISPCYDECSECGELYLPVTSAEIPDGDNNRPETDV